MRVSAKTDYACKALLELAAHWPNAKPMKIDTISRNQKIPIKFLTHILLYLKQSGYTKSIRGKSGGYLLAVEPKKIKLSELIKNLEQSEFANLKNEKGIISQIWKEVDEVSL